MSKIYDCFLYSGESNLLEIRLNTLGFLVDYFVIVEGGVSFQGHKKEFEFTLTPQIQQFENKIIYVKCGTFKRKRGKHNTTWDLEHNQRDFGILQGIEDADLDDVIMISDVDEIPFTSVLTDVFGELPRNRDKIYTIYMNYFMYYLNLIKENRFSWAGTAVTYRKNFEFPQNVRDVRERAQNVIKKYGGSHYTYLLPLENIYKKLGSFSHYEFNNLKIKQKIKSDILKHKDFISENTLLKTNIDLSYINNNLERFKNIIL